MQNKSENGVSRSVLNRLPRYYISLRELYRRDKLRVSSGELAKMMGVTASQIRHDLNCFGGFGQQGYGYNVVYLYKKIGEILGVQDDFGAVIIGAGPLCRAIASGSIFTRRGVKLLAIFDCDSEKCGKSISGIKVLPFESFNSFCRENTVDIAILAVSAEAAKDVSEKAALAGVRGIWNFTNTELNINDEKIAVQDVNLGDMLMTLCYEIKERKNEN